jgi:hypothetical protein
LAINFRKPVGSGVGVGVPVSLPVVVVSVAPVVVVSDPVVVVSDAVASSANKGTFTVFAANANESASTITKADIINAISFLFFID